jgi:hypothetical protein
VTLGNFPQKSLPHQEGHMPIILRRFRALSTERHVAEQLAASNAWRWWRGAVEAAEISCQYSTD